MSTTSRELFETSASSILRVTENLGATNCASRHFRQWKRPTSVRSSPVWTGWSTRLPLNLVFEFFLFGFFLNLLGEVDVDLGLKQCHRPVSTPAAASTASPSEATASFAFGARESPGEGYVDRPIPGRIFPPGNPQRRENSRDN